jgi:hypothetical protein
MRLSAALRREALQAEDLPESIRESCYLSLPGAFLAVGGKLWLGTSSAS